MDHQGEEPGHDDDTHVAPPKGAGPDGRPLGLRHDRAAQLRGDALPAAQDDPDAPQSPDGAGGPDSDSGTDPEVEQVAQQVVAFIQENHLHTPVPIPDTQALAVMRDEVPEVYGVYVKALERAVEDESFTVRAPFTVPAKFAARAQRYSLVLVLASLAVVVYALYAGNSWAVGLFGAIDLVGLAAMFGLGGSAREGGSGGGREK